MPVIDRSSIRVWSSVPVIDDRLRGTPDRAFEGDGSAIPSCQVKVGSDTVPGDEAGPRAAAVVDQ
jgi:hypothetical protein